MRGRCAQRAFPLPAQTDEWVPEDDAVFESDISALRQRRKQSHRPLGRTQSLYTPDSGEPGAFGKHLAWALMDDARARREGSPSPGESQFDRLTGADRSSRRSSRSNAFSAGSSYNSIGAAPGDPSVPLLCGQYIQNSLEAFANQVKTRTASDDLIESVSALIDAVNVLSTPSQERAAIVNASLCAAMSTEVLCSTIRSLRHAGVAGVSADILDTLVSAAASIASSVAELLQAIESGDHQIAQERHDEIVADIRTLSMAAGELAIATAGVNDDGDDDEDPRDEACDDPEEFAEDEEDAAFATGTRMVEIDGSAAASVGIDAAILEAFEEGTHVHVEKSLENLIRDMEYSGSTTLALVPQIGSGSKVSREVIHASSAVINATRDAFGHAQVCCRDVKPWCFALDPYTVAAAQNGPLIQKQPGYRLRRLLFVKYQPVLIFRFAADPWQALQSSLVSSKRAEGNASLAKKTFYRKSFARAKGIIAEVKYPPLLHGQLWAALFVANRTNGLLCMG